MKCSYTTHRAFLKKQARLARNGMARSMKDAGSTVCGGVEGQLECAVDEHPWVTVSASATAGAVAGTVFCAAGNRPRQTPPPPREPGAVHQAASSLFAYALHLVGMPFVDIAKTEIEQLLKARREARAQDPSRAAASPPASPEPVEAGSTSGGS
jgi:hypothetical protein